MSIPIMLVICLGVEGYWFLRFFSVNSSRERGFSAVCIKEFEPLKCIFNIHLLVDPDGSCCMVSGNLDPQIRFATSSVPLAVLGFISEDI